MPTGPPRPSLGFPPYQAPGYVPAWDPVGNYQGGMYGPSRDIWRISRKNTEGLFKFDGVVSGYKAWKMRIRDRAAEEWPQWRDILDHAERASGELTLEYLQTIDLFGVNTASLSTDLWGFLLKWIGPTLYLRRTQVGHRIDGTGLEL